MANRLDLRMFVMVNRDWCLVGIGVSLTWMFKTQVMTLSCELQGPKSWAKSHCCKLWQADVAITLLDWMKAAVVHGSAVVLRRIVACDVWNLHPIRAGSKQKVWNPSICELFRCLRCIELWRLCGRRLVVFRCSVGSLEVFRWVQWLRTWLCRLWSSRHRQVYDGLYVCLCWAIQPIDQNML